MNHSQRLTLQTADPSCAPNITPHHLNTLWLEPDTSGAASRSPIRQRLSTKYGPLVALQSPSSPFSGNPGRGGHILSPLGDCGSACFATPSITLTLTCSARLEDEGGHKPCLTRCPARLAPGRDI